MDNRPIGIFDSGIGGVSILNELFKELKNEKFIYLADNKNCPYGNKSKKIINELSIKNCKELIKQDCKIIIVACNTATTNSIESLRKIFNCPIIGIEPVGLVIGSVSIECSSICRNDFHKFSTTNIF